MKIFKISFKTGEEDEFKNIDQKIKGTISEAAEFAIESEEPDLSDLFKDIYLQH